VPLLVVEILSGITRLRDPGPKRNFYREVGVPTYWIVDGTARTIRAIEPPSQDVVVSDVLTWRPAGTSKPLVLDVPAAFREALGD
jgi:Uma2 family endonuclease